MEKNKKVIQYLKEEAEYIEIPDSIKPEQMKKRLEEHEQAIEKTEDIKKKFNYTKYLITAACLCLMFGITYITWNQGLLQKSFINNIINFGNTQNIAIQNTDNEQPSAGIEEILNSESIREIEEAELQASIPYPEITYEDIYESMFGELENTSMLQEEGTTGTEGALKRSTEDMAIAETETTMANISHKEYAGSDSVSRGEISEQAVSETTSVEELSADKEFGTTNVQTEGVDEGDIVKNDGRFLYQKIYVENTTAQAIQIIDTREKLTEVKRIEGFKSIEEFYVWEDILVVIENKFLETIHTKASDQSGLMVCGTDDVIRFSNYCHEITFYNIENRYMPYKIKTFTLKGRYDSSRISDGYFYGFSNFYADAGEGEKDYDAYIPVLDGARLESSKILLPEENTGCSYLVLVSIDLKNPTKFVETTAIVTNGDMYYVSNDNIYVADSLPSKEKEGWNSNRTSLLRFSYDQGKFSLQAEGEVKGRLDSSFSMDEYKGNLRIVSTVDDYRIAILKDDRTGEFIGTEMTDSRRSNALYVLDQELKVVGKIENLAEDEQIYSARFMGDTGYFVTFRQTDPLFAADLKDPENPKILSELKISGFSEYLHVYGKDRLLGIGMEADEETGSTEGMKLSMFDISDPTDVQEIARLPLGEYDHSEALYNHRAVLVSPTANLIGFEAEGYLNGTYKKDYFVFTYENEKFVQKLKLETKNRYGSIYSARGTFIGDVFYLLSRDGSVESYDLNTGGKLESLNP